MSIKSNVRNLKSIHITRSTSYTCGYSKKIPDDVICTHFIYAITMQIILLRDYWRCKVQFSLWVNIINDLVLDGEKECRSIRSQYFLLLKSLLLNDNYQKPFAK